MSTLLADVLAWVLFFGIAALGIALIAMGTVRFHRHLRGQGKGEVEAAALATGAALVLSIGGWLFLGLYWLMAWVRDRSVRGAHVH